MADETKLIIAIDFGTTFSGAAYVLTNRPDRVVLVTDWPNATSRTRREPIYRSRKVPTQLRFPPGGGDPEWGFLIPADARGDEVLRLIKLGLESKQVPPDSEAGKTVAALWAVHDIDRLIEQYLSGLLGVVLETIRKFHFRATDDYPVHFILTVPAIWSERSTQRTIRALQQARGFPKGKDAAAATVSVVSEPEAAAIYTLHKADRHDLKVGDTFLVVDAGGGTVDLVTYRVEALRPTLEVTETAPGSGGMCGSQMLNSRFQQFLDAKLGEAEGYDDEVREEAVDHFELDTKRKFRTAAIPHETYYIPLPGVARNEALGIKRPGRMFLKATEMHQIFEPIVSDVIRLVKEQIIASNAPVRKIMLVGGFGQSEYLKERIQAAVQTRSQQQQQPIEIIQPEYAWQSVVQGAVLKGLSTHSTKGVTHVRVKARAARKHYGTEVGALYNDYLHASVKDKQWYDGLDGVWRVDVMDWFIRRGEIVSEQVPFFKHLSVTQRVAHGRPAAIRTQIYADDLSPEAPLTCNKNVNVLCILEADLSSIPEEDLDRRRGADGLMYYVVEFQVESIRG
ncbi:hypothetical protein SLS62_000518 [Diatrype stigma]|uniref:Actin-like ATPase domain-containing protein n=1 Tax=Diatrype stigma TaxID=117547 RepID=A0AAN9YSL3_9PEZI